MTIKRSAAAELTGTENWLQLFSEGAPAGGDAGGGGGGGGSAPPTPEPTPAPSAGPEPAASPPAPYRSPGGGFRPPSGPNPLAAVAEPPAPAPSITPPPAPAAVASPPAAPVATPPPSAAPAPQQTPPAPPRELDFGGRKVPVPADPGQARALEALHFDWVQQQQALTRLQQQSRQQPAQSPQQTPPQTTTTPPSAPPTDEEISTLLYDRPSEAIRQAVQPLIQGVLGEAQQKIAALEARLAQFQPIQQQYEISQLQQTYVSELQQMANRPDLYPDMDAMRDLMQQVLDVQPHLLELPNPMATAYRIARGYHLSGAQTAPSAGGPQAVVQPQSSPPAAVAPAVPNPAPVSVESLLADPNALAQLAAHPALQHSVIQSYLQSLRAGQQPVVIPMPQGGGSVPVTPPHTPRTMGDASKAWRASLGNR